MRMPVAGGAEQEVLIANDASPRFSCSHTPGGGCVLVERHGRTEILSRLDPIKGRGPKILEITGQPTGDPAISSDGHHVAFVLPGAVQNRIRIVDLHGATESEITVAGAKNLDSLEWCADGTGFFSGDVTPSDTRLLHIQRDGASQAVWTQPAGPRIWGVQSRDGRHLATYKTRVSANVWIVENP